MTAEPHTILRIKRKRNQEALDALLVQNTLDKKVKFEAAAVFKLFETIQDEDQAFSTKLGAQKISRISSQVPDVVSSQKLKRARDSRFKVVKKQAKNLKDSNINMIDITREFDVSMGNDEVTMNLVPMMRQKLEIVEEDYVYDLYYQDENTIVSDVLDLNVGTLQLDDDDLFVDSEDSDSQFDSEDSNAENYFANDYPDEESDEELGRELYDSDESDFF